MCRNSGSLYTKAVLYAQFNAGQVTTGTSAAVQAIIALGSQLHHDIADIVATCNFF